MLLFGVLLGSFSVASAPSAKAYFEDFNPPAYTENNLSTQNGWVSTDPTSLDVAGSNSDFVGNIQDVNSNPVLFSSTSNYIAQLGGVFLPDNAPGGTNIVLSHTTGVVGDALNGVQLKVDFSIASSSLANPNRDEFGFRLTAAGAEYVTLYFTPDSLDANLLDFRLSTGGAIPSSQTNPDNSLPYNSASSLQLFIDQFNKLTAIITDVNNNTFTIFSDVDVSSAGAVPTAVDGVAAVFNVTGATGADAGSNSILFDNLSVVPEPSTMGLSVIAGLGGMLMVVRRRMKHS